MRVCACLVFVRVRVLVRAWVRACMIGVCVTGHVEMPVAPLSSQGLRSGPLRLGLCAALNITRQFEEGFVRYDINDCTGSAPSTPLIRQSGISDFHQDLSQPVFTHPTFCADPPKAVSGCTRLYQVACACLHQSCF